MLCSQLAQAHLIMSCIHFGVMYPTCILIIALYIHVCPTYMYLLKCVSLLILYAVLVRVQKSTYMYVQHDVHVHVCTQMITV